MVKKKLVYGLAALLLTGCGLTGLMGCGNKATAEGRTEIEIVSRSQNVAAKVTIAKKQLETEAEERLEEQQTPMKTKIIKWMPAICSTLAIVLSIISLVLRLYR